MKELSELMVDLAYSALFLKNKELSNHVDELFDEIKRLQDETLKLVFKVKINDDERLAIVDLLEYIKDYSNASVNLSTLSTSAPSIISDALSQTGKRTIKTRIEAKSFLKDRTVGDLRIHTITGLTIISVKRDNNWLFDIEKDFKLKEGDLIIGVGNSRSEELFNKLSQGDINLLV